MVDNSIFYESGQRIKEKREESGMTMEELGNRLGVNKSTIKRYEDGSTKRITIATFEKLASILNTTPKYLMGATERSTSGVISPEEAMKRLSQEGHDVSNFKTNKNSLNVKQESEIFGKMYPVPIFDCIAKENIQNILGYTYINQIEGESYFAIQVQEDSMNAARIFIGDIAVCRKQCHVENGEIAVVIIEDQEASIKRVYINENMVTLMPQSTNNIYQPITIDMKKTKFKIAGKVVKIEFYVK